MTILQIAKCLNYPDVILPSTIYLIKNSITGFLEIGVSSIDGSSITKLITKEEIVLWIREIASQVPAKADGLTNIRSISSTGDGNWTVNFDGTANATADFILSSTGVVEGSYGNFTIDNKGRITSARNIEERDLPNISGDKIVSTISVDTTGNAGSADKLKNSKSISTTGDAEFLVNFDGSTDVSSVLTLSVSGVVEGSYGNITVDSKGRVVSIRVLEERDLPNISGDKIISNISVDTTGNAGSANKFKTPILINDVLFDGSENITIEASDKIPRIAITEKGVANGVATLDDTGILFSSQLPSFVDDVIEVISFSELPGETSDTGINGVPSKGKIYVVAIPDGNSTIYRWSGTTYIEIPNGVGLSDTTLKLKYPRTISITGDGSFTVSFDGSENVSTDFALSIVNLSPGTFGNATVDDKGRVTALRDLVEEDLPDLTSNIVLSSQTVAINAAW